MEIERLLGNRVVVKPITKETKVGLIMPEDPLPYPIGIVSQVGDSSPVKVGEKIMYSAYSVITLEDKVIVSNNDIIAVIK